ncbi:MULTISPECIES: PAS domain-containing sensor histidine kinase [Bradyrhizobium]|uniref:histidine kinase n=2 Tax=Bradyrhizobium TaxID=374 RepID=A0ABY0P8T4_9BRAD|nr:MULTISPECIES: PAS domain S-box protein [Bradyrhizobium]SDH63401.1 PAS/PAC sensor hybrid histidine kinase [Bradyrhizobium ottawaense]SEE18624.1 PAS/PAC sensor hybrid histidine kinase [Bradyrhizobium lablabi]SHM14572.1 PAS/PAC sensor hybrid histidine kinase [Bradyrhizobium lablabi]
MLTPMVHGSPDVEASHSMTSLLSWLMSPQDYMPHGMCFLWQPELIALHVASDSLIALAYYSIPVALIYFVMKRTDLAFPAIFVLTGLFILACGTTHAMSVWTLWFPDYRVDGGIKAVTALLSVGTAVAIWKVMPLALALPSTGQLERANKLLGQEITQRQRAEAALREANAELERRVAARTADLQEEVVRRRDTEATLRASEERWRSMFEASAVGITIMDQQNRFAAVNEAFQKMVGYTEQELQSLGPVDITHEDDRRATREMIQDVQSGKRQDYQAEKRYCRKDGKVIWVRVSTARALDPNSPIPGIPAIIEDFTERKNAEVAWHDARDALSRATRLTVMGELSASIAHEVNQPLAAIITNGQACERFLGFSPPDLDEVKDAVGEIVRDARRASEVLKRIRAMSKNTAPERGQVDVNHAIAEVLALTRDELQRHRVAVQTDLRSKLPTIVADRVQLQQVVLNLVMNGIDAMRAVTDRPRILTVRSQLNDQGNIVVNVADSGVGLDPANRDRIFESFFTTKPEGMGMGLAISNTIIEAHHGRLWAESGSPFGAVFGFTLPLAAGANP